MKDYQGYRQKKNMEFTQQKALRLELRNGKRKNAGIMCHINHKLQVIFCLEMGRVERSEPRTCNLMSRAAVFMFQPRPSNI